MIATFKRDHTQIEEIIRQNVEKSGATVLRLRFYGLPNENSLVLCADLTVKTRQRDEAFLTLDHDQICSWIDDSLMAQGYERLAKPYVFHGTKDDEISTNARSNIICNVFYELRAEKATTQVI